MTKTHVVETRPQIFSVKRQMSTEAFIKATGNKCTVFGNHCASDEVE